MVKNDFIFKVYFFIAFGEDTAIRIRDIEGNALIQVFQSTINHLEAHLLFTPPSDGRFVIEMRGIQTTNAFSITTLIKPVTPTILELDENKLINEFNGFEMKSALTTTVEIEVEKNHKYIINLDLELTEEALEDDQYRLFGPALYSGELNGIADLIYVSTGITEGLNFRLYDKFENKIELRTRTEFDVEKTDREIPPIDLNLELDGQQTQLVTFVNLTEDQTSFEILSFSSRTFLLDISAIELSHVFLQDSTEFDDTILGNFNIKIEKKIIETEILRKQEGLVDPNNLFPECEVDQFKYTLNDDCETGVLLFCRNDIFPLRNTITATKQTFKEICECVEFLCATLPNGGDVTDGYRTWLKVAYGVFASISIIGFLLYALSNLDLIVYGGFSECIY